MIANQRLQYLFRQQLVQGNSPKEKSELLILMADPGNEDDVKELLSFYWDEFNEIEANSEDVFQPGQGEDILDRLLEEHVYPSQISISKVKLWPLIAAIAAAVALIISGVYFFNYNNQKISGVQSITYENDVAPGKAGATLTLANGKKISLTNVNNGKLATEAGVTITKTADGQLVYSVSALRDVAKRPYNTLSTAKGETYMLTLPDKSKVWLNAASSLTYRASLSEQGKRVVRLSGEAYFQVAKDKVHPFVVKTDQQEVEVLGTHFNINSYTDEAIANTTLLEGSIRINKKLILKPNEQANLYKNGAIVVSRASENAVAWKDGNFVFEKENIESIMRKVARWYNVEIVYKGERPKELYSGITKRSGNVSQILSILEETGTVKFKIDGNKIILSKNN